MNSTTNSIALSRSDLKGITFTAIYQPLFESGLSPIEVLILSETINFTLQGKSFYASHNWLANRFNVSRSTIKRTMSKLRERGYLRVTIATRKENSTSTIQLGPKTIELLIKKSDIESITTSEPIDIPVEEVENPATEELSPLDVMDTQQQQHSHPVAEEIAYEEVPAVRPASRSERRAYPEVNSGVAEPLTKMDEMLPLDVIKKMNYFPKKGRFELTEGDAVLVFGCYGLSPDQARTWYQRAFYNLPNYDDKLKYCKEAALRIKNAPVGRESIPTKAPSYTYDDLKSQVAPVEENLTEEEREAKRIQRLKQEYPDMYEMLYGSAQ